MLDVTPENLLREVEAAITFRDKFTDCVKRLVMARAGNSYREDWRTDDLHENHAHEFESIFLPQLIYRNPDIYTEARVLDPEREEAMKQVINDWVRRADFQGTMNRIARDVLYGWGVGMTSLDFVPGYESEAGEPEDAVDEESPWIIPKLTRVSPMRFFSDPRATNPRDFRFRGHMWIRDLEDLRTAKGADGNLVFDKAVLDQMNVDDGVDEVRSEMSMNQREGSQGPTRNEIVGYEVYVPEKRMIYTLARMVIQGREGEAVFLREPRKYQGRRKGPYTLFGIFEVMEQVYPVSPLAISEALVDELNAHAGQASEDAGAAKTLTIVDAENQKAVEAVTAGENASVWAIHGFNGQVASLKVGGVNPENLAYIQVLRERLDRQTGLSQASRGNVQKGVTASAENIAKESADVRVEYGRTRFQEQVIELLHDVAWQFHEREIVRVLIVVRTPDGRSEQMLFQGGSTSEQRPEDIGYKITPYSMEYVDSGVLQRRIQTGTSMLVTLSPAFMQFPWLKPRPIIEDMYQSLNIPDAGERYIDFELLEAMQQAVIAGLYGGGEEGGGAQGAQGGQGGPPSGGAGGGDQGGFTGAQGGGYDPNAEIASMLAESAAA